MYKNRKTNLEGYNMNVQLGKDPDLLSQAAAHIINVARLTNVSLGTLMELFVFENNFGKRSQQTLEGMSEPFRMGWREIFTGKGMRINEAKYISIRKCIMPLLVYEKKNKAANAMPITSGSMTHLSTSLAGAPTASAVPAAPLKRKSDFESNYFSAAPIASAIPKKQKSSGGASSGMNSHERDAAAAASSSNASAGAGARQPGGQSADAALTID